VGWFAACHDERGSTLERGNIERFGICELPFDNGQSRMDTYIWHNGGDID
jgi:hypothetical protein